MIFADLRSNPFADNQISLLKTFADQAVIAIENVRLFQETQRSRLEQQTATSEILGVIASSPTDIQPVLDVVAENAARLCDATDALIHRVDGDVLRRVARYRANCPDRSEQRLLTSWHSRRASYIDRQTIHVHDIAAESETEFPDIARSRDRTGLGPYSPRRCFAKESPSGRL